MKNLTEILDVEKLNVYGYNITRLKDNGDFIRISLSNVFNKKEETIVYIMIQNDLIKIDSVFLPEYVSIRERVAFSYFVRNIKDVLIQALEEDNRTRLKVVTGAIKFLIDEKILVDEEEMMKQSTIIAALKKYFKWNNYLSIVGALFPFVYLISQIFLYPASFSTIYDVFVYFSLFSLNFFGFLANSYFVLKPLKEIIKDSIFLKRTIEKVKSP